MQVKYLHLQDMPVYEFVPEGGCGNRRRQDGGVNFHPTDCIDLGPLAFKCSQHSLGLDFMCRPNPQFLIQVHNSQFEVALNVLPPL